MSGPTQTSVEPAGVGDAPSSRTPESSDVRAREWQEGWAVPVDRIDAFTLGAAISVEPDRIEAELAGLWRKAAERARSEGSRFSVTRACLWNLIVHSEGDDEFLRTKRLIDEVSETVPARIISLHETSESSEAMSDETADGGPPIRAFVEANFRRSGSGRREVVAEEITLEAPRMASQRLPGLVRSLLLADVPTALLVRNPTEDTAWLPRLAPEVERFIFDSGRLQQAEALIRVEALLRSLYRRQSNGMLANVDVVDLGWLRLWPWRILVASLFDSPDAAKALREVSEIVLHHAPGGEPAALLLSGWLCERLRLRWQATNDRRVFTLSNAAGHHVRLRIEQAEVQDAPAGIERVELRCGSHVFAARLQGESRCIVLSSHLQPERVQPVHGRPDPELMVAAMGVGGRDPLMYEALRHSVLLVRGGGL
jgi:glucose-6-phosphate dehydrogenase assembly protein OpcA